MTKELEKLKEKIGDLPITDTVFILNGRNYIETAVPVMRVYDLIDELEQKLAINKNKEQI